MAFSIKTIAQRVEPSKTLASNFSHVMINWSWGNELVKNIKFLPAFNYRT